MFEMKTTLAKLLINFVFLPAEQKLEIINEVVTKTRTGVYVKLQRRVLPEDM